MNSTVQSFDFAQLLPWWIIAALVLALALPSLLSIKIKLRGRIARLGFAAILGLILAQPVITSVERAVENDIAVILVDESESQRLTGHADAARGAADSIINSPNSPSDLEWRRVTIDQRAKANGDEGTALFTTLENALSDISRNRLAGVVVISDGIAHDGARRADLEKLPAPVHSIITGDPKLNDRRLVIERAPQYGLVGHGLDVQFRIDDGEGERGERAMIYWSLGDGPEQAKTVRTGRLETLNIQPEHRGQNILRMRVEALADEVSLINNEAILSISGVRDRLRVVLISGEPYQGERLWRATLKSDPAVDLVHFTILRLPSSQDFTPVQELSLIPFPTKQLFEDKLYDFDLVIFDRYALRGVLQTRYLANLATYVEAGGAVLVAVGPEFAQTLSLARTPLASVLPAQPSGHIIDRPFEPALTEDGARHPVTAALPRLWAQDSWGAWQRMVDVRGEQGDVLMTGAGGRPLLILNRVGDGRVALLTSDQSWLWGKNIDGGGPHGEFVRRLAHWLMKEPDLEEEALHATSQGETVTVTKQSMTAAGGSVTLTAPDGTTTTAILESDNEGRSMARISVDAPGLYRISDGRNTAFVAVGSVNRLELAELRPTVRELEPLSKATGGGMFWLRDGMPSLRRVDKDDLKAGRGWIGLQRNEAGRALSISETPLLPAWLAVIAALGLLALSWYRESR